MVAFKFTNASGKRRKQNEEADDMKLMKFAQVYKIINLDYVDDKPLIVEAFRPLRSEEVFLQEWANERCHICGVLRLEHHVDWNNIHSFSF